MLGFVAFVGSGLWRRMDVDGDSSIRTQRRPAVELGSLILLVHYLLQLLVVILDQLVQIFLLNLSSLAIGQTLLVTNGLDDGR